MAYKINEDLYIGNTNTQLKDLPVPVHDTYSTSTTDTYSCNYINSIVESGTNSNGTYIKYSNGVMMCHVTKDFGKVNISNAWGTMYDSEKLQLGDYPQPFVGDYPDIYIMPWASFFVERNYSPSLTSFGAFWAARPNVGTVDVRVSCFAIGRWK